MIQFLDSPHFNKGSNAKELKRLYQFILKAAPEFPEDLLQKRNADLQIFQDPNVVSGKLEKLMADLNKLLRIYVLTKDNLRNIKQNSNKLTGQFGWENEVWLIERTK